MYTIEDLQHSVQSALRYHMRKYVEHASYVTHLYNQGIEPDRATALTESKTAEAHRYIASELEKCVDGVQSFKSTVCGLMALGADFALRPDSAYHDNWQLFGRAGQSLMAEAQQECPEALAVPWGFNVPSMRAIAADNWEAPKL